MLIIPARGNFYAWRQGLFTAPVTIRPDRIVRRAHSHPHPIWGQASLLHSAALEWLVYPVGMLSIMVGFSLYGVATVHAKVLPRWYGVVLIVFLPISVFLGVYAYIWVGVVQLVLGSVLWTRRALPTESAPRVHGLRTTEKHSSHAVG
jgi:hypothetical protein